MTDRFQVVPAAYMLFRRAVGGREQVLLQLRRGTGYMDEHWACAAAGHVEADESAVEAACREAFEELGVRIASTDLVPICAMHRTQRNGRPVDERVDFFFECRRWTGDPDLQETDKAVDLRWFDLSALPEPVVPHELFVIKSVALGTVPSIVTFGFERSV